MDHFKNEILKHLNEIAFFLEYHDENPFRIRAYQNAIEALGALSEKELEERLNKNSLTEIKGIGKGIQAVVSQFAKEQSSEEWREAKKDLPISLIELTQVSGLGAKKIKPLYEKLFIQSFGELERACRENRLVDLPSFGEKTQIKILKSLEDLKWRAGKFLLSDALIMAEEFEKSLPQKVKFHRVGSLGRRLEIVESFDYLVEGAASPEISKLAKGPVKMIFSPAKEAPARAIRMTSSDAHWTSLEKAAEKKKIAFSEKAPFKNEREVYESLGLNWCESFEREQPSLLKGTKPTYDIADLKGVFHLHTTRSDGVNTLEEMAAAARAQGWKFMGLSDHSQTAFYAKGLAEAELKAQSEEIEALNQKYPNFRILRGVESDILKDGSLDYPEAVLKQLDFVIASIHSRYGMTDMTDRILRAIENPYTTMVGHLTGRLLLARDAYDVDHEKIISAAIKNNTIIELNAHPQRLDMDWRYLSDACKKGLLISINPDAHAVAGFEDVKYGVWLARKAGVPKENIFNMWPYEKILEYLEV